MSNTRKTSTSPNATSVAGNEEECSRLVKDGRAGSSILHSNREDGDRTPVASASKTNSSSVQSTATKKKPAVKTEANKRRGLDSKTIELIKRRQQEVLEREREIEEQRKAEELRQKLREEEEEEAKERTRIAREREEAACRLVATATTGPVKKPGKRIVYPDRKKPAAPQTVPLDSLNPVDERRTDLQVDLEAPSVDEWEKEFDLVPEVVEKPSLPPKAKPTLRSNPRTKGLRAPILSVVGHVDAGKTTLLDNLRQSQVQKNEAGGITQQLGATNVPIEILRERTSMCPDVHYQIPGLLIIDTPGHEIFHHLRSRGSSVCDLAILVVDITHGLEVQTIKSIELLVERQMPFIVALNKIDQAYGWRSDRQQDVRTMLDGQKPFTKDQLELLIKRVTVQFAEKGLNVGLYDEDLDWNDYYPMVPISAKTGDGIGSLIAHITQQCQTKLLNQLVFEEAMQASVMEVKTVPGLGSTIDIILVNGSLSVGDNILVATQEGSLVTQIRSLWVPGANEEQRVTNHFDQCEKVVGARSVRVVAKSLDKALAGFPIYPVRNADDEERSRAELDAALQTMLTSIRVKQEGVYVQASTFGSLEGLLRLLKNHQIPYAGVNIGPVHRKDVIRASAQLGKDPKYAAILAFDVSVDRSAQEQANKINLQIIQDDEVYRLVKRFKDHEDNLFKQNKEKNRHLAVFPCRLRILPRCVFAGRNPIICGVKVEDGFVKIGTPICVPSKGRIELGRITSIQLNHKPIEIARKGAEVSIKIESATGDSSKIFGRHFDENDELVSKISRESIDTLKMYFRDDMTKDDWQLVINLKKVFEIL